VEKFNQGVILPKKMGWSGYLNHTYFFGEPERSEHNGIHEKERSKQLSMRIKSMRINQAATTLTPDRSCSVHFLRIQRYEKVTLDEI
jgi:hypothetical protein